MSEVDLPECGVARFLLLFDGPWATLIVRELMHGPQRFGELRAALPGISAHTLTNRLRMFESRGIVSRHAYPEVPPRVVYELTDLGRSLRPVLDAMNEWGASCPKRCGPCMSSRTMSVAQGPSNSSRNLATPHSGRSTSFMTSKPTPIVQLT